jgi:sugar phosphate isomerase/epimerase
MRISFSTGSFYHRGLGYSLGLARDLGFDGVELALGPEYLYLGTERIARVARSSRIPVLSVHPPFFPLPGWPRRAPQRIARVAEVSRRLGAELFVVHAPSIISLESARAKRYTLALRLGRELAGERIGIALENTQYGTRGKYFRFDDPRALADYALAQGCGLTLDTCHAGANGEDLLACYAIMRPALRNVHLSDVAWRDGEPVTHRLPGTGTLPLRAFLGTLARDGYDGLVTLEIHPKQLGLIGRRRHADLLGQALAFVREAIAQPAAEAARPEAGV